MRLDLNARRNLELAGNHAHEGKDAASLLWVLDQTKTAMGKRLIRSWLEQPLMSPGEDYAAPERRGGALWMTLPCGHDIAEAPHPVFMIWNA